MDVATRLRQALLPVFGLDSIDDIAPDVSLVKDIGADSLDFVEITYLIEKEFGVVLKMGELLVAGAKVDTDSFFAEGRLTEEGAGLLNRALPNDGGRFRAGMTKMDLFQSLTVNDLANAIALRLQSAGATC
jgi:acyl carrier protein